MRAFIPLLPANLKRIDQSSWPQGDGPSQQDHSSLVNPSDLSSPGIEHAGIFAFRHHSIIREHDVGAPVYDFAPD